MIKQFAQSCTAREKKIFLNAHWSDSKIVILFHIVFNLLSLTCDIVVSIVKEIPIKHMNHSMNAGVNTYDLK